MTPAQLLHAEVAHQLRAAGNAGHPATVDALINEGREASATMLQHYALNLRSCSQPAGPCMCLAMAAVYDGLAREIRDAA